MYRQKRSYENTTVKHSISGNSDNIYRDTKAGQEENMKKFDYSLVKDPQYFCDGRMEAHSDHMYYRSEEERESCEL